MFLPLRLLATELHRNGCWKDFLQYQKTLLKTENNKLRIDFLVNCKCADLIPKFLKFRIPQNGCFDDKAVHDFQKRLLNKEIIRAKETHTFLLESLDAKRLSIRLKAPTKCILSIILYTRRAKRKHIEIHKTTHNNKLSALSEEQGRPLFSVKNTVITVELENEPPKFVLETLSLGPKNAILDP